MRKKNNLMIYIITAIIVFGGLIGTLFILNQNNEITEADFAETFQINGNKTKLTINSAFVDEDHGLLSYHMVYTATNEIIDSLTTYYLFVDTETAQDNLDFVKESVVPTGYIDKIYVNDRYVVVKETPKAWEKTDYNTILSIVNAKNE